MLDARQAQRHRIEAGGGGRDIKALLVVGIDLATREAGLARPGLCERNRAAAADNGPTVTLLLLKACKRPLWLIGHRVARAPGSGQSRGNWVAYRDRHVAVHR